MFSWMKRFFDTATEPSHMEEPDRLHKEIDRLKRENNELRLQQKLKKSKKTVDVPSRKIHIEFFLYDAGHQEESVYSESDIHRYPMMGFTIHFLEDGDRPDWLSYLLKGLEESLKAMKVGSHRVEKPNLYSQFVDLKLYPHIEVKKSIYLVFQQLHQWQINGKDLVSFRVHIGGEDLYQELLNTHLEAV
ncbi:hypothetical protein [Marininema halotolerans]|uniref:Uncharacterized protein n=1 Tax=Marininema halotolerans TaxID=1155944 RepID=A0A1I6QI12_9BACL|nr:hypothetical protein [Marininema halotolerans]SFS52086.1 hypothetical protein SAMN05444972_103166 [Marininema halotolerans]